VGVVVRLGKIMHQYLHKSGEVGKKTMPMTCIMLLDLHLAITLPWLMPMPHLYLGPLKVVDIELTLKAHSLRVILLVQ